MALNGEIRQSPEHWHGKPPTHSSFDSWVNKNGKDAYQTFVEGHPMTSLSYEAWRQTDQVYGGYLFYVASLIWAEDPDSDEENVKRQRISRVQGDNAKKTATTNGNGAPRTAGSATPTPAANSDEISASGKRKRKPRKKYMSQEIVASDEEAADEVDTALPTETRMPAAPEATVNGRRKSASRKPRRKPISDETISPEDENEDTMEVDAPVVASPLPVRSAPRAAATPKHSESPKKATPKQASVKKSRKSFLVRLPFHLWDAVNLEEKSEEMELDEDTDNGNASFAEVSRPATTPAVKYKTETSNTIQTDTNTDEAGDDVTAQGTPDPSNNRRGLRNRRPAQQRPYYHDAQVFEDVETEGDEDSELESLSQEQSPEPPQPSKPRHFKGKGRAWKKDGSDEDEEFVTPKEKKAAKAAKAKAEREKAKVDKETGDNEDITWALMDALDANLAELIDPAGQSNVSPKDPPKQKNTRKPRKSNLSSGNVTRDAESDNETPQPTPAQPTKVKRGRGRPRKSVLSSEIVRDESDDEAPASATATATITEKTEAAELTTPPKAKVGSRPSTANTAPATTPRKRGRPRKSENIATPKASARATENAKEKQQRGSMATEADLKTTRARTSVSSVPEVQPSASEGDFPMPSIHRGAALVESLYPREDRDSRRNSPIATPAPVTDSESVQVGTKETENPVAKAETADSIAKAETENSIAKAETENAIAMAQTEEKAAQPEEQSEEKIEVEEAQEEEKKKEKKIEAEEAQTESTAEGAGTESKEGGHADDDAQSAAMSLSSEGEL